MKTTKNFEDRISMRTPHEEASSEEPYDVAGRRNQQNSGSRGHRATSSMGFT
jgi:hypothetical protein